MDKYEFRVSLNEINSLVQERRFDEAAEIADTIDWRKVKSPDTLCRISDIYKICKDYERARDILDLANQRNPHIPNIVYSLCELTIFLYGQTGSQSDLAKALGLKQEYESECPDDPKRLILEYKFYKVSPVTLNEKIATLEQLRDEAPSARWEYELASLYHQAGNDDLALAACGSIQRNYSGKFADKAAALAQEINPSEPAAKRDPAEAVREEPAQEGPVAEAPAEEPVREAAYAEPAEEAPVREEAPAEETAYEPRTEVEDRPTEPIRTERAPRYEAPVQEEPVAEEPVQEETPASEENLSVGQVYDEWERIRRDIRRRNDEQRAQRIMQDTGPLLQDFDETARHGLIEAIEKDAARARRQVRSGASSILGDDGYDRGDRYTDRYNDNRGYRDDYRDDRYDDRYDDRDDRGYRTNNRSYEPLPPQDEYYPEDNESGEQYPEDRYADDQYAGSESSEEQYVEEPAAQEEYTEESVPEERDNSITAETVHVGPEENDHESEPRRGSAFAAAVLNDAANAASFARGEHSDTINAVPHAIAGAAAGAAAAHLADEAEDVATRRWNSDEIRGALAAAKEAAKATKDVDAGGITARGERSDAIDAVPHAKAAATTAAAVADKAQDVAAAPAAETAAPAFDPVAERARIEAEVRAQIAAEQEAARKAAEEEAARKAAEEEAARKAAEEEAARKAAEEEAARKAAEEEAARKAAEEEAARKAAEEEAARKAAEDKIRREAEEKARKDAEEQARAQMYAEIEARVRAEYEQKAQAEAAAKAQAEAEAKAQAEAEAARKAAEEEAARQAAEEAARKAAEEEAARQAAEEAARKAAEEEAARKAAEAAAIAAAAAAAAEAAAVAESDSNDVVEESVEELSDGTDDGINQVSPEEEPIEEPAEDAASDDEAESIEQKDADTSAYENVEPVNTDAHEGDDSDEIAERHIPAEPVGAARSNYDEDAPASAASSIATANEKAPSPEELRLFGPFYRMKENRDQVTMALDKISLASYTGNLIITGNAVTARRVAQGLLELTREADSNFTGKIAKATGTALNNLTDEKFHSILSKIENGALIIEHASTMEEPAVQRLYNELEGRDHGVIVVLMDAKKPLDAFLETYKTYVSSFSARVDIRPLNDRALVDYGKDYANSKDYALDEMAELALSSRISSMQSPSHRVTLKEVRDIIDEAITHASRKTPHALMEVLSRKRYDADDRILLREKDFTAK